MGECIGRPTKSELEKHKQKLNRKNDKFFTKNPISIDPKSFSGLPKIKLERILDELGKEKKNFTEKMNNAKASSNSIPEIIIEIKKALDLFPASCFDGEKPFVIVSLEPQGPQEKTFEAEKYLPEWFKLIRISRSLHSFESLKVSVMYKEENSSEKKIGEIEFFLKDLEDQKIREGWYEVRKNTSSKMQPLVELRVQMIKDEKALHKSILDKLQELEDQVHATLEKEIQVS